MALLQLGAPSKGSFLFGMIKAMKSHLISRVVLKRFANTHDETLVHDIKASTTELKPVADIAYKEVPSDIIGELEQQWGQGVENDAEKALNALASGNLLHTEKHIQTIKHLMALHYIRSVVFILADKPEMLRYRTQVIERTVSAYPEHRGAIEAKMDAEWPNFKLAAATGTLKDYLPKITDYMDKFGLEVGETDSSTKFLLGDIPTATTDGTGKFGVLGGVPILQATEFVMPMTPRHIVGLKSHPLTKKYRQLTGVQVRNSNSVQIAQAMDSFYSAPNGNETQTF
jgi:hypothetical protein